MGFKKLIKAKTMKIKQLGKKSWKLTKSASRRIYTGLQKSLQTKHGRRRLKQLAFLAFCLTTNYVIFTGPANSFPDIAMPADGEPRKDMGLVWTHAFVYFILGCLGSGS